MKNRIVGWDDGKLYFYDETNKEYCVNNYKELLDDIVKMCTEYFKKQKHKDEIVEK